MNLLRHRRQTKNTCGQTCVAIIANVELERAIEAVGRKGGTHGKHLIEGLVKLGIETTPESVRFNRQKDEFPSFAIMRMRAPKNRDVSGRWWGGHWVVIHQDIIYDPAVEDPLHRLHYEERYMLPYGYKFTSYVGVWPNG